MLGTTSDAFASGLTGAGSIVIAPLESQWAAGFQDATGNTVSYAAVGESTGYQDVATGQVDFGALDGPLTPSGGVTCSGCVLVPWALSATGLAYNISGVGPGLKLTGNLLAKIYLGDISNWDSPAIAKVNNGVSFPDLKITPVFISGESGDSYAFTGYLSAVSKAWAAKHRGATSSFPTSMGVPEATGSAVATEIGSVNGSIGYLNASYLVAQKINVAQVQNAKGKYEPPGVANIAAAASEVKSVPAGNVLSIVDPPKEYGTAYPISEFGYALVPANGKNVTLVQQFLTYCVTTGRSLGLRVNFAPIPTVVQAAAQHTINGLS
jgi:phosphate transport system substrate-binding protein